MFNMRKSLIKLDENKKQFHLCRTPVTALAQSGEDNVKASLDSRAQDSSEGSSAGRVQIKIKELCWKTS